MRRIFVYLTIVICSFSLSSCLDIFENIHFNSDGSGKYSVTLSIKEQMREQLRRQKESQDSIALANKDIIARQVEDDFLAYKNSIDSITQNLNQIKGIYNVQSIINQEDFVFGYEFEFENVQALNRAFEKIAGDYTPDTPENYVIGKKEFSPTANYIEVNKNSIIRHQSSELGKILKMNTSKGSNKGMMGGMDIAYLLQDLNYTTTFTFDKKIQTVSNVAALIDSNGNSVTLTCKPFEYKSKDLKTLKLQELSCKQEIVITTNK
ncbi:MAG: hypothetical protein M9887_07140 [Chitinophagales bacterium]|nr:hypothetical protein [Chitinophagales bacterium]